MAGRIEEAIDRFLNAQRVSETLSALTPDEAVHKLRLAVALTMVGLLQVQLGHAEDAESALTRAVAISQDLTDSDADNEDMLALALSMLGVHYVQTARTQDAETTLRRAVVISEKLSTRNPEDHANQLQFANTLTALGGLYMQAEKEKDAEDVLIRAVAVSQHLTTQKADEVSHLLLASALLLLGTHYLSVDREHEAEDALTGSISVSQELVTQNPEEVTRHHPPTKATDLLGGALYLLGVLYLFSDREQEAEDALTRVVAVCRDRSQDPYDGSLLASTLDSLAELYRMQGRVEDLERSLALRQRLNSEGGDAPAGI